MMKNELVVHFGGQRPPFLFPGTRRSLRALFSLMFAAMFPLSGCGKRQVAVPTAPAVQDEIVEVEAEGPVDPSAVPTAEKGGTYTTWGGPYPKSLNMWLDYNSFSGQITSLMFESLVEMHATEDEPVGVLAKSWEISEDGTTYTFHIHPAAKWSDGKPVTAEDVQFYYDVIMNPKNLTSLFRVDMSRFERPEVVDERTVRIKASENHWKNFWAAAGFFALPKHVWKDADFNKINFEFPVVSGPYELGEVKTNRSIQMKRRSDWWGRVLRYNVGKYNFDYLVFKSMEDRNKALEVLKKGEFDMYPIYTAQIWAEKTHFDQVKKNWIVRQKVFNKEPRAFQGFAMNMRRPTLADVRVRKALAMLLNRELMSEKLMFNEYFLLNSYYPDLYPDNQNPDVPVTAYNPDQARALLSEAGWNPGSTGILEKDGQQFSLTFLHYEGSDMRHLNIYLEDLKAVGINAKIELLSRSSFTKRVDSQDFDMIWVNWGASRLRDPEAMWSSRTADEIATQNYCGVKDPEIDALIEQQKTEMDLTVRNEILKKIDARLMEISPYVLLWQSGSARLLYWNKFGTPPNVLSKFGDERGVIAYWWYSAEKAKALEEAMRNGAALPAEPAEVHYAE
jgi:microcin C transport system substrate-binding protein